jgi:hypothetical protein
MFNRSELPDRARQVVFVGNVVAAVTQFDSGLEPKPMFANAPEKPNLLNAAAPLP